MQTHGRLSAPSACGWLCVLMFIVPVSSLYESLEYDVVKGYMPEGNDVRPPEMLNVSEARNVCDADVSCMGFTFSVAEGAPVEPALVYFKSTSDSTEAAGWLAYIKWTPSPPMKTFTVGGLVVELRAGTGTVQRLALQDDDMFPYNFSFVPPVSWGGGRPGSGPPGCHQLGDITLRVRTLADAEASHKGEDELEDGAGSWSMFSSAYAGPAVKVRDLPVEADVFAAADITAAVLPAPPQPAAPLPLKVTRAYEVHAATSSLVIRWTLANSAASRVRIGGLGLSLPADSNTAGMQLEQIAHTSSFVDPHIGGQRGFAEWVRVAGNRSMVVVPHTSNTHLEAWRPVMEDCMFDGGMSEWTVHSKAWAQEWQLNQQAPFTSMDPALYKTGVWPHPQSPWPAWEGNESVRVRDVKHWNPPSAVTLQPGETISYALRFSLSQGGPRGRDAHLLHHAIPVVHSVPGYVLSTDMADAALFVHCPNELFVASFDVAPPGVLEVAALLAQSPYQTMRLKGLSRGRARLALRFSDNTEMALHYHVLPPLNLQVARLGRHWGRVAWLPREFPDPFGRSASVMPYDREDNATILDDSRAYVVGLSDDAGAANNLGFATKINFMPVQEEVGRVDEYIRCTLFGVKPEVASPPLRSLQDPTTDGVRMTMYYYPEPNPANPVQSMNTSSATITTSPHQRTSDTAATAAVTSGSRARSSQGGVSAHDRTASPDSHKFRNAMGQELLAGSNQPQPPPNSVQVSKDKREFVRKEASMNFAYDYKEGDKCKMPVSGPIWCMTEKMADQIYRSYNYPHQTAVYWAMYRVARFYDRMKTEQPWQWYLERAWKTMKKFQSPAVGVMDGTVFREVLLALKEEGSENATFALFAHEAEGAMRARADVWARQAFPYGSEFNFDTTGQEEVFVWLQYFNHTKAAARTLDAILGFMRSLPNWAWNGGSRSMGDLGNNGKWFVNKGVERGLMHYRAGLNMIPLMEAYRQHPDDHLLLEIGMGAIAGQMCNIDDSGATSMMFHSFPFVNEFDPRSGDYGLGFFGHSIQTGAYYVHHPHLGRLCYLCNLRDIHNTSSGLHLVEIIPKDSYRQRVFIEPLALYLRARTGTISSVKLDLHSRRAVITLAAPQVLSGQSEDVETSSLCSGFFSQYILQVEKTSKERPGSNFRVINSNAYSKSGQSVYHMPANLSSEGGCAPSEFDVTWSLTSVFEERMRTDIV